MDQEFELLFYSENIASFRPISFRKTFIERKSGIFLVGKDFRLPLNLSLTDRHPAAHILDLFRRQKETILITDRQVRLHSWCNAAPAVFFKALPGCVFSHAGQSFNKTERFFRTITRCFRMKQRLQQQDLLRGLRKLITG